MRLTEKELTQLHELLDKACVLWQYYEKEHVDINDEMSDDEWESFVDEKQDAFAIACESALEDIQ
tara:strand:+ start:2419 stop:2613 length:195 start_codon:yes stop_codon:yes gene_type:complete